MKVKRKLYLSDPLKATRLDWDDPDRLFEQLSIAQERTKMEDYGWILLGNVDISFTVEKSFSEIVANSIAEAEKKIQELDAEFARRRQEYTVQIDKMRALGWTQ